jgi:hypothetical protein
MLASWFMHRVDVMQAATGRMQSAVEIRNNVAAFAVRGDSVGPVAGDPGGMRVTGPLKVHCAITWIILVSRSLCRVAAEIRELRMTLQFGPFCGANRDNSSSSPDIPLHVLEEDFKDRLLRHVFAALNVRLGSLADLARSDLTCKR